MGFQKLTIPHEKRKCQQYSEEFLIFELLVHYQEMQYLYHLPNKINNDTTKLSKDHLTIILAN